MKKIIIIAALLAGVGFAYWTLNAKESEAPEQARGGFGRGAATAVPVTVATVQITSFKDRVDAIGTTLANESVLITAKVTDKISQIGFTDGQFVEKGDILVELTNDEQTAQLNEAKADRNEARTQLKRLEDLADQGTVAVSQVDEVRARYSVTNARLEAIVARLRDRVIRAPFDGLLGFRQVSPGTLVSPGTTITTLDDVSTLKLDFSVPELFLGAIDIGDPIVASSPAYRGKRFEGTVTGIGSRVNDVTRTITVRALLPNDDFELRPGMLLTVELQTSSRDALAVPEASVIPTNRDAYVYVIGDDSKAEKRVVKSGQRSNGLVEILSGLEENERVAVLGLLKLRDGAAVSVIEEPESAAASVSDQEGG